MKRLGIYSLLCALALWVSPGVAASLCGELLALLKDHSHVHSVGATGDEDHHHAVSVDADACCLWIFVGGADEIIVTAPSPPAKPVLSERDVLSGILPTPLPLSLLHNSRSTSSHLEIPANGLQAHLYVLFSTYLI